MVSAGGSISAYGAFSPGAAESQAPKNRTSHTSLMTGLVMCVALVGLLAVASVGEVQSEGGAVELLQKEKAAVDDLHFVNSLKPSEAMQHQMSDASLHSTHQTLSADSSPATPEERLTQAKMQAENRIRQAKARKQVSAESKEEAMLRKQLDSEVKQKQQGELKAAMSKTDLSFLQRQDKGASQAKDLKVKITNVNSGPDGDLTEEAALRKQLNAQAKKEQDQLLEKQDPEFKAEDKLAAKPQVSESQLEAQLRDQLNEKVHKEKEGMFKSAVTQWLSKDVGVKAAPAAAASQSKSTAATTKLSKHALKASDSASLLAAERIMKASLASTKVSGTDTTLAHQPLNYKLAQKAAQKTSGLEALEQAMLKSTLQASKQEMPQLKNKQKMMAALRQAATQKALKEKADKPSYKDAMLKFSKRLMENEHSEQLKYTKDTVALRQQFSQATKKALENSIKQKVQAKLTLGNPELQQARAKLLKEFGNAKSLFAKTEQAELKSLQQQQQKANAAAASLSAGSTGGL